MDEGREARQALPPQEGPGVTTGALARRLGVSPTTLRSWDRRYGLGPVQRSRGRHRRWTDEDIAVVEEMCRLTTTGLPPAEAARLARKRLVTGPASLPRQGRVAAGAPTPAALERLTRGISRAATRLDSPTVHGLFTDAVRTYGLVHTWQDVMVPVLHAVGRKWEEAGDRYVEVEHLLSWHVSRTLHQAVPVAPVSTLPPLVLACVPAEQHVLPLEALSAALAELGIPQRMFGAAVPVEAVSAAVRRTGPRVVVLWAQARSTASLPLARHLAETHWGVRGARGKPAVMLCGPGWAGRSVRGALRPSTLPEALLQIGRLYPEISRDPAPA
ncbi:MULTISPECIES: MerR family transcriptional regulator [unclassified Streptomyces]|uniref:MerR family transcriptional regulator n=1 Tax=unclassified Streptomyces TaxID=2593676 RepID=UPI000DBA0ECF|nr:MULTISPECIES: MerR family transcriptional regulator [unclassified Streptomyces]MYT73659.1 MerR family transcriptional regulator [Streptomyces sp. SID8367]RAJ85198.1 B12 binding protein [Streptomyces sp. PsTaAH-137]